MSNTEILALVKSGKLSIEEAARQMEASAPVVRVAQFRNAKEFLAAAKPVDVQGGLTLSLSAREFSSGSYGWSYSGKVNIMVGDRAVRCQGSINLVVIGSKPESAVA